MNDQKGPSKKTLRHCAAADRPADPPVWRTRPITAARHRSEHKKMRV
ncbi:hypothetical protein [Pandoraea pnomenusa]|jgi:hypothetical protein|nr:hypothetical protein [Pandoraea pnomenusa]MBN9093685.1 hypothetical protein [Pandoraea pnomenusa]